MASIVQRSNRYNVVYLYDDEATGKRKQKWEALVLWRMRSAGKPESNIGRNWAMWSFSSAIHWMTC